MGAFKKSGGAAADEEVKSALETGRDLTIVLRGKSHRLTIDMGEMTPGLRRRLAAGNTDSVDASEDTTIEAVTRCVTSWDVTAADGSIIPLTTEGVRDGLSYNALNVVLSAITEAPNATGATAEANAESPS